VREKAIFWIGQHPSADNAQFLRGLFTRLRDGDLKEKVLFSLGQMRGMGNERWLLGVAADPGQSMEVRKKALFWAGQAGVPVAELAGVYDRVRDREMREQAIFALSQRMHEPAAVDKLIDIARREPDGELRKKAIFWLGQSRDPRAVRALSDLINQ
jgi:hypothetical protein